MKHTFLLLAALIAIPYVYAQDTRTFHVVSPDKQLDMTIETGAATRWSVNKGNNSVIAPSIISLSLENGEILGKDVKVKSSKNIAVNTSFNTAFYKKKTVINQYNEITITCKGDYGIIARAYNDGVAYRFFTNKKGVITILSEQANFNFDHDFATLMPYVRDLRGTEQYVQSFEALYSKQTLATAYTDTLAFLPIMVNEGSNKVVLLEADLEDYPGMFINGTHSNALQGSFAPYPTEYFQGGYNKLNTMVGKRAPYIARVNGTRTFPWRVAVISSRDADLANSDMVQKLSAPSRIADESWIKPGKVAWDWWNDWNISHVDFRAGINTDTYKYYIDFAAANKLEYIILDEGWSDDMDLMKVSDKMDLKAIIDYGKQKNVGVILWAGWYAVDQKMEQAFTHYSNMGVKGFKIDFMDRDDQPMVASLYEIAKKAAEHHLLVDYHGMYKPTGLQRTYPNVVNFEGVKGLENNKWTPNDDVPEYDVTIPFIRMVAGPMDYTPGAMRNANKASFRPLHSLPMSQGTRCHQLAMYIVYEAPLQMLADNPTAYKKEQECTDFIAAIPTVFDETIALGGSVGEYVVLARKKDDTWYVGAMNNWSPKMISIDFSFVGTGQFEATVFKDGINADRDATDYKKEVLPVDTSSKINFDLMNGGGLAIRIRKL